MSAPEIQCLADLWGHLLFRDFLNAFRKLLKEKGMNDWIEVFRVGRHTDSGGNTQDWTFKDLEKIASSYNPQEHEAPIVIGHPETDSPAYGWIEALKVEGEKLLAKPGQLVEQFKDWIRKGLYKKVSIALYPDLTLRHVGFLGAMPPAVKGLQDIRFQEKGKFTIYLSDIKMEGGMEMSRGQKIRPRMERATAIGHKFVALAEEKMKSDKSLSYDEAMTEVQKENLELISELESRPTERLGPKMSPRMERARTIGYQIVSLVEEKMKADKNLSYAEAMTEVQKGNRELILEFIRTEE
jgi:hypothetical protein